MTRTAVIGAGMTGLACARTLQDAGRDVSVFDKGRGLGGRLATRRADPFRFDHGAQYIVARSESFATRLREWQAAGTAAVWAPRDPTAAVADCETQTPWHVGSPSMSALVRPLSQGLEVELETTITTISSQVDGWWLTTDRNLHLGPYDAVAVTAPAPQSLAMLHPVDRRFASLAEVTMAPCWATLIAFETPLDLDFDVLRPSGGPIAWAARNGSKPDRTGAGDTWVLHGSADWSRDHLEEERDQIALQLLAEFAEIADTTRLDTPTYLAAHRWRYALVETPLGRPCLHLPDRGLVAAGDWCLAPRVEAAYESGVAAAESLLGSGAQ